jgi:hypothetical protein
VEIRDSSLALQSVMAVSELEAIPQRTDVPGIALHPSGALVYIPFITGPAPASAPFTGLQGGVDIMDAHSGRLRLRVMLPEPLAMLAADVDGLHGKFLAIDENGQRIFALTASGLSVVQLARVPLGIGTIAPASGAATGGTTITIRGSGFQSGASVTIDGKAVAATFVDMNTLKVVTPALPAGAQRIVITNPAGKPLRWTQALPPTDASIAHLSLDPSNFSLALVIQSKVETKGTVIPSNEDFLWKRESWATPTCN